MLNHGVSQERRTYKISTRNGRPVPAIGTRHGQGACDRAGRSAQWGRGALESPAPSAASGLCRCASASPMWNAQCRHPNIQLLAVDWQLQGWIVQLITCYDVANRTQLLPLSKIR